METKTTAMPRENPMGYAPVNGLLLKLGIPMMISMLVQAMYNVVDSIFVSHVGEAALSAVSLAFPAQSLMISFGVGTAVGVNALLSKSLGEREFKQANRAAGNGLFLSAVTCVAFVLFGLFGVRAFMNAQTHDGDILAAGISYLSICCIFSQGIFLQTMSEKLLVATGRSNLAMASQLAGALTNIVLDPIFIFGYFGVPAMGAAGAAVATVVGQYVGGITSIVFNVKLNKDITLDKDAFTPRMQTIKKIYQVGLPSIAMQSIGSVMTFSMNKILIGFTSTAVAVFGVYFKLQSFIFMPLFGMNNGMVPIVSFNYGARKPDRIIATIKCGMMYAGLVMGIGFILFQCIPGVLLSVFNASAEMEAIGQTALRIISVHFLLAWFNIIGSSAFQALGRGTFALMVSVVRQLVVLIPVAFLLSMTGNLNLVWLAFPIAEIGSLTMTLIFLKKINKEVIKPMQAETAAQ